MLDPERLRASNATKLERRLLSAGGDERPSPELTNRMRQAVGLSAAGASATALAATKSAGLAWISAGIIAAAIVGAGAGVWTSYRRTVAARAPAPAAPVECAISAPEAAAAATPLAARPDRPRVSRSAPAGQARARLVAASSPASVRGDLHDEIALVDEARTALREQAPRRSLALLRRYVSAYPNGTLGPEAEALRVEALDESGQHRLARSLAREFVSRHPESPLAERVRRSVDDRL